MKRLSSLACTVLLLPGLALAQSDDRGSTDTQAISATEIAVYDAVLDSWLDKEQTRQNVDIRLKKAPPANGERIAACVGDVRFSADPVDAPETKSLAGTKFRRQGVNLIDGSTWKPVDPSEAIARGKSVEAAVEEAFASSLISFSQIRFSADGRDALVRFSMVCGSLCGSGTTLRLHKSEAGWEVAKRCDQWVS